MATEEVPTELVRQNVAARASTEMARPAAAAQYATGFEGASLAPFSPQAVAVLGEPVKEEEVEVREDGIVYMPGVWYRRQLFRAFGPGAWALLPRGPSRKDGEVILYPGALYVLGRFVSEAIGECEARWGMTYASALEGARTDALSRCCKDLGMAAELWDRAFRDSWLAKYTVKEWKKAPPDSKKKDRWVFSRVGAKKGAELVEGRNAAPESEPSPLLACTFCGSPRTGPMRGCCAEGARADADGFANDAARRNKEAGVTAPPLAAGRNAPADAPTPGRTSVEPAVEAPGAPSVVRTSPPDDVPVVGEDTGVAPDAGDIVKLQGLARALKWSGPHARNWLKKHFGVDSSGALTAQQCGDAIELLTAAQIDDQDAAYGLVFDRLLAAERIKK